MWHFFQREYNKSAARSSRSMTERTRPTIIIRYNDHALSLIAGSLYRTRVGCCYCCHKVAFRGHIFITLTPLPSTFLNKTASRLLDGRVALIHILVVSTLHIRFFYVFFVVLVCRFARITTNYGRIATSFPSSSPFPEATSKQHSRSSCHRARRRQHDNRRHPPPAG